MTPVRMVELAVAVALIGAGIWAYRRRDPKDGQPGGQGAVLMFVVAAIVGAHAVGLMDYRPSQAEREMMADRAQ